MTTIDLANKIAAQVTAGWTVTEVSTGDWDLYGNRLEEEYLFRGGSDRDTARVKFERTDGDVHAVLALTVVPIPETDEYPRQHLYDREMAFEGFTVEGHTVVNDGTFTRRGIDCASHWLHSDPERCLPNSNSYSTVAALLDGEWNRCVAAVERRKTMVDVPGLPGSFRVTPETKAKITETLKAGKPHHFAPHGFGTGYMVFLKPNRRPKSIGRYRYEHDLPASTSEFFGVGPLVYTTTDCD